MEKKNVSHSICGNSDYPSLPLVDTCSPQLHKVVLLNQKIGEKDKAKKKGKTKNVSHCKTERMCKVLKYLLLQGNLVCYGSDTSSRKGTTLLLHTKKFHKSSQSLPRKIKNSPEGVPFIFL